MRANRRTVEQLMHGLRLQSLVRGKAAKATLSNKAVLCPANCVNLQFRGWSTSPSFVCTAFLIDAFARRIEEFIGF